MWVGLLWIFFACTAHLSNGCAQARARVYEATWLYSFNWKNEDLLFVGCCCFPRTKLHIFVCVRVCVFCTRNKWICFSWLVAFLFWHLVRPSTQQCPDARTRVCRHIVAQRTNGCQCTAVFVRGSFRLLATQHSKFTWSLFCWSNQAFCFCCNQITRSAQEQKD